MSYYPYSAYGYGLYGLQSLVIFSAVGLILGIICAILGCAIFLKKDNETKFSGFVGWMYDFFNFKKMTIEVILKFCYIVAAVWLTVASFGFISSSFFAFLGVLIFGNIILRISYEMIMLFVKICRNTSEMNKKMNYILQDELFIIDDDNSISEEPVVDDAVIEEAVEEDVIITEDASDDEATDETIKEEK